MSFSEITVRVAEAKYHDVGKGIARLPRKLMREIDITSHDIIEIIGPKSTTATVLPAHSVDENLNSIFIDSTIRKNAGTHLDSSVRLKKVIPVQATEVIFTPLTPYRIREAASYFKKELLGRPICVGDKIQLEKMGKKIEYISSFIRPEMPSVIISDQTIVKIQDDKQIDKKVPSIAYEDIGGLDDSIQRIREMVELPMRHPELFAYLGVEPPKGVLLHGPPGTGKTLLAKAVANETESSFFQISGPEIMSKFHGESEERIREVFTKAQDNAPSIIFMDEIDSIAPKRDESGTGEVEKRVVSQLLAILDGIKGRGEVIIIGATNRPNALDPALRRPGRFDREIEIGVPDKRGRLQILEIHTRSMPLDENVNLEEIASRTHGFVGADLSLLVKESAMKTIRRFFPNISLGEEIPTEEITKLKVELVDFNNSLVEIRPSGMREFFTEIPNVSWDDVGGLDEIKKELKETVEWSYKYSDLFDYMSAEIPRGILLAGPSGTGKTMVTKALVSQTDINFINVKCSDILSKWLGESEKAIHEIFRKARYSSPCLIFFDEIDAIFSSRSQNQTSDKTDRIVSTLITEMDGIEKTTNVLVLAATNRSEVIDSAVLRTGRFDRIIEFSLPDYESRLSVIKIYGKKRPIDKNVDLNRIAKATDGFNNADLSTIFKRASFLAIERFISKHGEEMDDLAKEDHKKLLSEIKPVISEEDLNKALSEISKRKNKKL